MSLAKRNLVTIDDISNQEIEAVFSVAEEISQSMPEQRNLCTGLIMATLFFEPSTRTRLSFEAAMHRMGGSVVSAVEIGATSLAKGESIADMARVVGSYADIIVLRHPWEGAAKVAADYAGVPVINAGDGSHEHPTQTLCDLYTLKKERQQVKGLKIALCGDLKYGRTIHSLIYALARFGAARIYFCPGPGLEMPPHVLGKLTQDYGGKLLKAPADDLHSVTQTVAGQSVDAIYVTPSDSHQLALMPGVQIKIDISEGAIYVTRWQKERAEDVGRGAVSKKDYPVINARLLKGKGLERTLVMHPLPRIDELAYEIDADPRSMYFEQAARGVPVRMALVALLLGVKKVDLPEKETLLQIDYPLYKRDSGVQCQNPKCVSVQETETRYIKPEFKIIKTKPLTLRCFYCEHETHPQCIASSKWHQGILESKRYYSSDSFMLERIKAENLIIFGSEREARAQGFKRSQYATTPKKARGGAKR
ncbi:MAG: aspartate carbamoyltransferase catalytic subunit [Dehalococcoidia bacterium]